MPEGRVQNERVTGGLCSGDGVLGAQQASTRARWKIHPNAAGGLWGLVLPENISRTWQKVMSRFTGKSLASFVHKPFVVDNVVSAILAVLLISCRIYLVAFLASHARPSSLGPSRRPVTQPRHRALPQ